MLKKILLSLALSASLFAMHDASMNLNNDDIELNGNIDLGELNQSDFTDIYFLTLGFLDVKNAQKTNPLLEAGFKLRQNIRGVDGLKFGIGFKGVYTKVADLKFAAVPLGVELAYTLPLNSVVPIVLSASFDFAPRVLSYQEADNYMEARAELGVQIIEQGTIFLGYRKIDTNFDNNGPDYTYNETGYIGFRVRF